MRSRLVPPLAAAALLFACSEPQKEPDPTPPRPKITNLVEDWRDEVVYQLLTDRFADGDPSNNQGVDLGSPVQWHGGDFKGIADRIPYLQALGVTTVWISPVVKNVDRFGNGAGYHGYWTQDFTAVEPHFGTRESLVAMIDALHAANIKVVLDVVTNHVGPLFFYDVNNDGRPDEDLQVDGYPDGRRRIHEPNPDFDWHGIRVPGSSSVLAPIVFFDDPSTNRVAPQPPEFQNPDWYNRRGRTMDWGNGDQVLYGDFPSGLKDLKTTHPDVRAALLRFYKGWMELDFDGFRLDTVKHVEHDSWIDFCRGIRSHAEKLGKKNFFLFGEALDGDHAKIGAYTKDESLDTLLNFPQKFIVDEVFRGKAAPKRLKEDYDTRKRTFATTPSPGIGLAAWQSAVNFLDNHDLARFLANGTRVEQLHAALALLFLEEGVPAIYYGTEQRFTGSTDPENREDLWSSGYAQDGETFQWIARLARLRKAYPALRRGETVFRWASESATGAPDAGLVAFERLHGTQRVLVVVNASSQTSETSLAASGGEDMKTGFAELAPLKDALGGGSFVAGRDGRLKLR
ncbi:MAG: alpha-amylase family glycosyl hydrolase, partial [Myxococcales bacterium]